MSATAPTDPAPTGADDAWAAALLASGLVTDPWVDGRPRFSPQPVNHASLVGCEDTGADGEHDVGRFFDRKSTRGALQVRAEILTTQKLHHQVRHTTFGAVVRGVHHVTVLELRRCLCFAQEAHSRARILGQRAVQHLQRDRLPHLDVGRLVDGAHSA